MINRNEQYSLKTLKRKKNKSEKRNHEGFLNNTEGVNGDTRYWGKILLVFCNYLCSFKYCLKLQMKRGLQQITKSTNKVSNFISLTAECSGIMYTSTAGSM